MACKTAAVGENPLLGMEVLPDFKDSSVNIAYAEQGGLGLPDRSYYFDADKKPLREAYQGHVAKVLELTGVPSADAAQQAARVMAFETRLARLSKSAEEMSRDVSLYYHPVAPDAADKLTPNFPWTSFFRTVGLAQPKTFSLAIPGFHKEVNTMLAEVPVADWQSYLRYRLVRRHPLRGGLGKVGLPDPALL